jgi:glutamate--cysteine ligase
MLSSQSELYLPVRIKSKGENSLKTLKDSGIDHIELRMFDINPFEKVGISKKDLEFAHYMMIYFSLQDKFEFDENMQKNALINHKSAALLDKDNIFIDNKPIIQAANKLFSGMQECFSDFDHVKEIISYQKDKLYNKRICDNICDNVRSFYYV